MKISIASTFNRNCGIGQYTEHLTNNIHKKASIQTYRKDDEDGTLFIKYPYRSFKSLQYHVAPYYLMDAIKEQEADVWHADHVSSLLSLQWSSKKPMVVTAHDAIPFFYGNKGMDFKIYKYQLKQAIKHAKQLIVVSETAKKDLVRMSGVAEDKVVAIPNGINFDELNPGLRKVNEVFTIRYLGGLGAKHKNVPLLLHAAKILEEKGKEFKMEIAGYMPESFYLRDLAKSLKLSSVSFPGFIPDEEKAGFLANADLFVFPSLMEGFGFPPMEAMASGTPVVASKISVFEELFGDDAMLTDPKPEAFASSISKMMDDKGLRSEYAEKGMAKVKNYTWEQAADRTLEVYDKAIKLQAA